MKDKIFQSFFVILGIFFLGFSFPVYATTFPILGGCSSLNSTDMSTQMAHEIDSRIDGVTASDSTKKLWTTRGDNTSGWVRNPNVWTAGGATALDFSGASPWNINVGGGASGGYVGAGTLISPRHILLANHSGLANGSTIIFVDNENNIISRTLVSQKQVSTSDIQVGVLNEDVPNSIAYYPIIDLASLKDYWKNVSNTPVIFLDQEDKAILKEISSISDDDIDRINHIDPVASNRNNFNEALVGGDSGNPIFGVIGGQLVLLSTILNDIYEPFAPSLVDNINNAMTELEGVNDWGHYQVSTIDLSCFASQTTPTFSSNTLTFSVKENSLTGTEIGSAKANENEPFVYSITNGNISNVFSINSITGIITLNNQTFLDHDYIYTYEITVKSQNIWYWPKSSFVTVFINVIDVPKINKILLNSTWIKQINNSTQGNWTSIASSSDGTRLAAVMSGDYIYTSTDKGVNWTKQTNSTQGNWTSIASSSDGTRLAAVMSGDYIYTSTDKGVNWTKQTNSTQGNWTSIASSSDGTRLAAVMSGDYIYTSTDKGVNWTKQTNSTQGNWTSIASSSDGTRLAAVMSGDYIYTSTDKGVNWTKQTNSTQGNWTSIASSSDGTRLAAVMSGDYIYTSTDKGVNWTKQTNSTQGNWTSIASSSDGTRLAAVMSGDYIYTSTDKGVNWTKQTNSTQGNWTSIASSSDGTRLAAVMSGDYIYTCSLIFNIFIFTIDPVSSITTNSAVLNATITDTGGTNVTTRGFNYGLNTDYGQNTIETGSFSTGAYSSNISSLICNTVYYYRSYATNSVGTSYGENQTFTTSNCPTTSSGGGGGKSYSKSAISISTTPSIVSKTITNKTDTLLKPIPQPVVKILLSQININNTFKKGKTDNTIKTFQQFLNSQGYIVSTTGVGSIGNETNYFGQKTKQALIKFQKANKLTPDGIFGPKTIDVVRKILEKNN